MKILLNVLTVCALVLSGDAASSTEDPPGTLDDNVIPKSYKLDLTLEDDFYQTQEFFGSVTISLVVNEDTDSFLLHAVDLNVTSVSLVNVKDVTYNNSDNRVLQVISTDNITKGNYDLAIEYSGKLSSTSMHGFYLSSYDDDEGGTHYLATTQFEEELARRAFPCFDEPRLKATFEISINHPENYTAISNTLHNAALSNSTTTVFEKTPTMSTYLVAFIVSDFQCTKGTDYNSAIPTRVCARNVQQNSLDLALKTAPDVLSKMFDYTKFDYKDMKINQLTQAAIPDFAAGAMENWGLITYREVDLLWDPNESPNNYQQLVITVVAHELSHQWFGDLVTLNWWSDIFLNEGFATYFQYHIPDLLYPNWEFQKQFVVEQVQTALLADSTVDSLPLSYYSVDEKEIMRRFDEISYNKGGSVLRMVQHLLGLENFKSGLADYIKTLAEATSTPQQLWSHLQTAAEKGKIALPKDVTFSEVMENWTTKAGYPLLTVTSEKGIVTITQKRFLFSGENDTTWYVPISYSVQGGDFSKTTPEAWVIPDEKLTLPVKDSQWIVLNNQQTGYYRVHYDNDLLTRISTALKEDIKSIDEIGRSQLIDDQFNLARAGIRDYNDVLNFMQFLQNDTSYYSWYSAFVNFDYLILRISDSKVNTALEQHIITLMNNFTKAFPFDKPKPNDQIYTLAQVLANTWACRLGVPSCVQNAVTYFEKSVNGTKFDKNLKSIVYCYGLKYSRNATRDFEFLMSNYVKTNVETDKILILNALGCVNASELRKEFLEMVLKPDVRIQDARYVFLSVASHSDDGVKEIIQFLKNNSTEVLERFGDDTTALPYALSTAAKYIKKQDEINELKKLDVYGADNVNSAVAKAETNLKMSTKLQQSFKEYFQLNSGSSQLKSYHFFNLIFIFVGYIVLSF